MSTLVVLLMAIAATIYAIHPLRVKSGHPDTAIETRVAALRAARCTAAHPDSSPTCPTCGHPFRAGDAFCPHCSKRRPSPCPHCGRQPAADDLYCAACGTYLKGEGPQ